MDDRVLTLSDPYANYMINPLPRGSDGTCPICLTFVTPGYKLCRGCADAAQVDGVATSSVIPITYSVDGKQMHDALRGYKDSPAAEARTKYKMGIAAVLYRFLDLHEPCFATYAGVKQFGLVTTVPSSYSGRHEAHPLVDIVGRIVRSTRDRFIEALSTTDSDVTARQFSRERFTATSTNLSGADVLLIDDTWTTGASAQSAAAALLDEGASAVGILVIGRHVRPDWNQNEKRLGQLSGSFDWERCADHSP